MQVRIIILLLLLSGPYLQAQNSLKFNPFFGKVAKHKADLLYDTPPRSLGFELTYSTRTNGSSPWHHRWNRPTHEISILHFNLGNNEVLGSLTAIIPYFGFYIREKENSTFRFQFGIGAAYVTKKFDEISNPTNNAIGSNLNSIINFKFAYEWQIKEKLRFYTGLSFTHFSNGKTSSPNSGINVPALFLGTAFTIGKQSERIDDQKSAPAYRKWGINIHIGSGIKEYDVPGGPKYPVTIVSLGGKYATDAFNKVLFGWEYEYHKDEYAFAIATFKEEIDAQKEAKKQMLYLGDELLFGNVSLRFQIGYYLVNTRAQNINTKLFVNYRIPIPKISSSMYFGIMMKTHFTTANYLSLVGGYEF